MTQCLQCGSDRMWKAGVRKTLNGDVQRYYCRDCGKRFSESALAKPFYTASSKGSKWSQIGATPKAHGRVINLADLEPLKEGHAGATTQTAESHGRIVAYMLWLKKQGYAETTIIGRIKLVKQLVSRGAILSDPETVKEAIVRAESWSEGRKELAVEAYSNYLLHAGGTWNPPRYKRVETLPFIPTETELDQLIAGCGQKTGTFLQLLKETGARCGEAWQTEWTDIDTLNNTIRIKPEKHSSPRIIKISTRLIERLTSLPNTAKRVFGETNLRTTARIFERSRKLISAKTKNPRLARITFHTFRHWKATMEYHKTKDILHVMRLLGHKNIKNTLIYTQLVDFNEQDYTSKVAWNLEEACKLVESGFQYVCEFENAKIFKKPK